MLLCRPCAAMSLLCRQHAAVLSVRAAVSLLCHLCAAESLLCCLRVLLCRLRDTGVGGTPTYGMLHCPPYRGRVFRGSTSLLVCFAPTVSSRARGLYKEWPEWCMDKAVEAVSVHGISVRRAAQQSVVHRSILPALKRMN